jgi:uncharacterized protein YndB with AHSA1/START domain
LDNQTGDEMTGRSGSTSVQGEEFVISRVFDAPRELVWKAVAESDRLARWWGPKGFTISVSRFEFRPGGIFHYRMVGPDGNDMWGRWVYREIAAPERVVFVNSFSDEAGGLTRAPFSGAWPLEMLTTLTLAEQGGKTTLTLRVRGLAETEEERKTFEDGFESMQQGFGSALDQLGELLAKELARA